MNNQVIMDKFFDAMNVSNFTNGKTKRQSFQSPYRSKEDFRLKVICKLPVTGLNLNKKHIDFTVDTGNIPGIFARLGRKCKKRQGFCDAEKKRMLLSPQTLSGLRLTGSLFNILPVYRLTLTLHNSLALSFVGLVKYLYSLPLIKDNKVVLLSNNIPT